MPRLTLCMIVRNEERFLAQCLESARPAVDRMVIVDTGSSDGTREIIRRFGAELVEHEWNDDFSAARNAGLERVESGYVLVLDADERLTRRGARVLRAVAGRGEVDLGMLPLHDAASLDAKAGDVLAGRARRGEPMLLPRLLRRTPDLRFEGTIHESPAAWAQRQRRVEVVDAPIIHYGAAPELRASRGKEERNRKLLERRCDAEPENPTVRAYLAAELRRAGAGREALERAREAWGLWRELRNRAESDAGGTSEERWDLHDVVLVASVLGHLALRFDHEDEAAEVVAEALEVQAHPNLHLLAGLAEEQRATNRGAGGECLERAAEHYLRCLDFEGKPLASEVMEGATSWQAAKRLGTVRLQAGQPALARAAFEQAIAQGGDSPETQLGLAEATAAAGAPEDALTLLEPHLEKPDTPPDAWLVAARAALDLGSTDSAKLLLERAQAARSRQRCVSLHRYRHFAELERELERQMREAPSAEGEGDEAVCVFAWPCYDEPEDMEALLGGFGKLLADRRGVVLCLRHDSAHDGDVAEVERRIAAAYEAHLGAGHDLDVMLFGQALEDPSQAASLASERDLALELPHTRGVRSAFLDDLGTPRLATPAALEQALSRQADAAPASPVPGPETAELELEIAGKPVRFFYPDAIGLEPFVLSVLSGEDYPIVFPGAFEPTTIVDIGAHAGAATVYLKAHYPEAEVFAFEPSAAAHGHLLDNVKHLSGVEVERVALGDRAGEARLFAGLHSSMQVSLKPNAENTEDFETVEILEAGAVLERLDRPAFSIVKIDTEGCELEILASIDRFLDRIEVLYLEYHSEHDRLEIDRRLSPRFLLHSARATEAHRGTNTYVRADVFERCAAQLEERFVFPKS